MATKKTPAKKGPTLTTEQTRRIAAVITNALFLTESEKKDYLSYLKKGMLARAPTLSLFNIKAYDGANAHSVHPDGAVYDTEEHVFRDFDAGEHMLCDVLDAIAFACEEGKLNSRNWARVIFSSEEALEWFLSDLETYDQVHRLNDRWWMALARLAEHEQEEQGFIYTADIAQVLREHIEETRQGF